MSTRTGEYARITLQRVDDKESEPYVFDVKLELESRRMIGEWVCFGLCGNLDKKGEWYPVTLKRDGTLDWGALADTGRYWRTNLRERKILRGELVTIWSGEDEEFTYRISLVALLGEKLLDI